ncbi:MAG: tetratricopeptide repeat protein, partial [Nitrospira sp.]|nr:tetratricopeptide repeat protein [Nitrospira sp.]
GMGDYAAAKEYYEAALAIDPKSTLAANNLAMLLVDRMPSEENNRRALELALPFADSKEAVLLDTLGWVYYRMGDYGKALPVLQNVVELNSISGVFRYHLGMAYYQLKKYSEARHELNLALKDENVYLDAKSAMEAMKTH